MKKSCALIVFIRNPDAGKVKTRLAARIGESAAIALYASFIQDILAMAQSTGLDILVFVEPAKDVPKLREIMEDGPRLYPQRGRDLGEKMKHAMDHIFRLGYAKALLMGSDIPDLPAHEVVKAVSLLDSEDCVLGPSKDGGYYLVGFKKEGYCPEIFSGPDWGTCHVLEQTTGILSKNTVSYFLAKPWRDVDELDDLVDLHYRLSIGTAQAQNTWNCLKSLLSVTPGLLDHGLS